MDSGVSHAVTGIEYEAARAAAFMGYKMICEWEGLPVTRDSSEPHTALHRSALARLSFGSDAVAVPLEIRARSFRRPCRARSFLRDGQFMRILSPRFVPEISYRVRNCTRYASEENQRIQLFVELARGSPARKQSEEAFRLMGELMYQSHYSYTECGLGNEATDLLVDLVRERGDDRVFMARK